MDELATQPRSHPIQKHWPYGITGLSGVLDNVIVNLEQVFRQTLLMRRKIFLKCWNVHNEIAKRSLPKLSKISDLSHLIFEFFRTYHKLETRKESLI
ncbi:unnamed protein product [Gongylonema pulchrum]|uniref:Uncharacterized protein n=1 Tax=Gongylonema pulchrum TaxID=637853 RepID=A0A183E555_9BILA|nr:unnamed protein product [Gongylonema pulchrum]